MQYVLMKEMRNSVLILFACFGCLRCPQHILQFGLYPQSIFRFWFPCIYSDKCVSFYWHLSLSVSLSDIFIAVLISHSVSCGSRRGRDNFKDLEQDGRIIKKDGVRLWTGFKWPGRWSSGSLLWTLPAGNLHLKKYLNTVHLAVYG
jgi:hypothetical protein